MVTSSKFEFDTVFEVDRNGRNIEHDAPKPQFTDDDLAAARGEGQQLGFEAGRQQAHSEIDAIAATALQLIAAQMKQINHAHRAELLLIENDAANLALTVAGKLASALLAQQPLEEVRALVTECLATMSTEPRIVVRLAEPLIEPLQDQIDQLITDTNFDGQVALLVEPSLTGSDCRVEWADGGAERDLAVLSYQIEDAVERYCASLAREREEHLAAVAQDASAHTVTGEPLAVDSGEIDEKSADSAPPGAEEEDLLSEPLPVLNRLPEFEAGDDAASSPAAPNPEEIAPDSGA